MNLTFYPPNKKRRDLDNVYASMKSAVDGMCQGLNIDDSQIRRVTLEWGGVIALGAVELELKGIEKWNSKKSLARLAGSFTFFLGR